MYDLSKAGIMTAAEQRQIRVGMVGGGTGAGIAETHPTAMRLDDRYVLVAGVFSRDREKSLTHNYSGYAMVRHAARMVRNGELGEIRLIQAEHASGLGGKAFWKKKGIRKVSGGPIRIYWAM